jgi:hypothetical protein
MAKDIRKILMTAERAFGDAATERAAAAEGIILGETVEMTGPELLAMLDNDEPVRPRVLVTVHEEPSVYRATVEDAFCAFVEGAGIGAWTGGGEGAIDDVAFFDVIFEVEDHEAGAAKVRDFAKRAFPELNIEVSALAGE